MEHEYCFVLDSDVHTLQKCFKTICIYINQKSFEDNFPMHY